MFADSHVHLQTILWPSPPAPRAKKRLRESPPITGPPRSVRTTHGPTDGRRAGQLVAGAGRHRCAAWARRGVAAFVLRPDPSIRSPAPVHQVGTRPGRPARHTENSWNLPHRLGKVKSGNPVTRSNSIAGPAPRFSPTRSYPECSARKRRHTRAVYLAEHSG